MSTPLRVRRYEPPEKDAVWSVHDRTFRESPMTFYPWFNRSLRHTPETFLDDDGEFLVGVLPADERVVAVGGFLPVEDRSLPGNDGRVAELRSVRVDPAF